MHTLMATAKHLRIDLDASLAEDLAGVVVRDGPSLQAAFSNLVLNAMYEGSRVSVECEMISGSSHKTQNLQALLDDDSSAALGAASQHASADNATPGNITPGSGVCDSMPSAGNNPSTDHAMESAGRIPEGKHDVMRVGYALLTVCDNGEGPPPEVANEIFEPFVTSKPEGLGLGLPLVARCARRLEGEVKWDRVGQQTRFSLRFKVMIPDDVSKQNFSESK